MAGENFCAESLERRRKDAQLGGSDVCSALWNAIVSAENVDIDAMNRNLDQAQARITSLRNDLADLAMERERQMDLEDELCGR